MGPPFGGRLSPWSRQRPALHAGCLPLQKGTEGCSLGTGSGGAVGRRREASHQAGADGGRLVPGNPGLITRTSTALLHPPQEGAGWQETDPFGWLEGGGLRNPCHSRRLPPFSSSPVPCLCQLSSFLLPPPGPPRRSPSSSPLCFPPPLLPLVELFTCPTCLLSI